MRDCGVEGRVRERAGGGAGGKVGGGSFVEI